MAEGSEGMTKKICYVQETNTSLQLDMFAEILSWLPVQSVIVSKCVCKAWKSVIEDPMFLMKHRNRAMAGGSEGMTKKICYVQETNTSLPLDLFAEILSWLPVQSVIVSKCVCKAWKSVIEDPRFLMEHRNRASTVTLFEEPENSDVCENKFKVVCSAEGLVLEGDSFNYRITNPATRQVLRLPDPVKKRGVMHFNYLSESMVYKLIHLHSKGPGSLDLGCEVLTVGEDLAWRGLIIPSLNNIFVGNPGLFFGVDDSNIYHIIRIAEDRLEHPTIIFINLVTESASCCEIPRKFLWDWNNVYPLMWKKKLSLTTVVKDKLIIWVLENYKTNQWADREIIIPLTSTKEFFKAGDKVYASDLSGTILSINVNDHILISYDIEEKKVKDVWPIPAFAGIFFKLRPSLVQLKGMQAEKEIIEG